MKPKILFIIRAAVSLVLMAVLIYIARDSIPDMVDAVKLLSPVIFMLGFILYALSVLIASFRLKVLLSTQNIFLNVANIAKLNYMGYFFSSFLPTSIGGDIVKALYISKASNDTMRSYTTVFLDRYLGMSTIFLIATWALFYTKEMPESYFSWLLPLLLFASVLFLIFIFSERSAKILSPIFKVLIPVKMRDLFKNIYDALYNFKRYRIKIFICLLISTAGQITAFSAVYFFANGLDSALPLKLVLLAMPIATIVSMLPSIYGMGPREVSIVIILSPFIGKDKALVIAFLWLSLLLLTALIGGFLYIMSGKYKIRPSEVTR